jgi:hypothetical protein
VSGSEPTAGPLPDGVLPHVICLDEETGRWLMERDLPHVDDGGTAAELQVDHFSTWGLAGFPAEAHTIARIEEFIAANSENMAAAFQAWTR